MLEELHVRDLALIEEVWLEFGPGLTALTGETGAGKTALVGALKLLVGERGDSTLVRAGAGETLVEGRMRAGERELLARRRITADGRSKCTLDGEMASVGTLAETLGPMVDLHGQHDHQALLQPASHAGYLDGYAGTTAFRALEDYREARRAFLRALESLDKLEADVAEAARQSDYLRFVVAEIEALAPRPDEDLEIESRLPGLRHGERLTAASASAFSALREDGGASDAIGAALAALRHVAGLDPALDTLAARLESAAAEFDALGGEFRDYGEQIEADPEALNALEARQAALSTLKKKYGPDLGNVLATAARSKDLLSAAEDSGSALAAARESAAAGRSALETRAGELSAIRASAVEGFVDALESATLDLEMRGVRFDVALESLPFEQWTEDGPERVEFLYAPGPDQPFRPLAKIASGGEISRVMLALKGVLGEADDVPVLVFDEVDSGIGGATALAVGRRLKELASRHQVLVVTHLAQVAVFADRHLVVEKLVGEDTVSTTVREVDAEERISEIARMLSGADTEASRAHAAELLGSARGA